MQSGNYSGTLHRPGMLETVCIMGELLLVDARSTADRCHSGICFSIPKQGCRVEIISQLIVTVNKICRQIISVCDTSLYMPFERFCEIIF